MDIDSHRSVLFSTVKFIRFLFTLRLLTKIYKTLPSFSFSFFPHPPWFYFFCKQWVYSLLTEVGTDLGGSCLIHDSRFLRNGNDDRDSCPVVLGYVGDYFSCTNRSRVSTDVRESTEFTVVVTGNPENTRTDRKNHTAPISGTGGRLCLYYYMYIIRDGFKRSKSFIFMSYRSIHN